MINPEKLMMDDIKAQTEQEWLGNAEKPVFTLLRISYSFYNTGKTFYTYRLQFNGRDEVGHFAAEEPLTNTELEELIPSLVEKHLEETK